MRPETALEILGDPRRVKVCWWCPFAHREPAVILEHQQARHGFFGKRPRLWRGWYRNMRLYNKGGET